MSEQTIYTPEEQFGIKKIRRIAVIILAAEVLFVAGFFINMAGNTGSKATKESVDVVADNLPAVPSNAETDVSETVAIDTESEADIVSMAIIGKFSCGRKKFHFRLNNEYHGYFDEGAKEIDGQYEVISRNMQNVLVITYQEQCIEYVVSFDSAGNILLIDSDGAELELIASTK